jgi:hypothetical protein
MPERWMKFFASLDEEEAARWAVWFEIGMMVQGKSFSVYITDSAPPEQIATNDTIEALSILENPGGLN